MEKYIIIGLAVLVVVLLVVVIILAKKNKDLRCGGIKIKKGVRYTTDESINKDNKSNITFNEKDIVLEVNQEHTIDGKNMLSGTYYVLATNETYDKFNIRISGIVREYKHGEKIVLKNGDTITAVSHNIILR